MSFKTATSCCFVLMYNKNRVAFGNSFLYNQIMKRKSIDSKKVVAILLIVVFSLVAILKLTTVFLSIVNYKINSKKWNDGIGIIYDQHLNNIKDYRYGFGTIGENGCGAVAIYNIMCLENKKVALPDIIKSMDNGQIFFGLLGTKPTRILSYLKKQGFDAQLHEDKSKFEVLSQDSKYCIYIYVGKSGGHYTLLIHNSDSETFRSINPCGITTMSDMMEENQNKFINLLITVK